MYGTTGKKLARRIDAICDKFVELDHHDLAFILDAIQRAQWHAFGVATAKGFLVSTDVIKQDKPA